MRQIYLYIVGILFSMILLGCSGVSDFELKRPSISNGKTSKDSEESSTKSSGKQDDSESSEESLSSSEEEDDEDEVVSNIQVCVFYARNQVQLVENECNCHHCKKGSLSVVFNNVSSPVSYSVKNWASTRTVDLIKGGQRQVGSVDHNTHNINSSIVDGYYKTDIPGQVYTGGEFDDDGNFKIKIQWDDEPSNLGDCQPVNAINSKCGFQSRGKMDQILYSVIGQVGEKYFKKEAKILQIGNQDVIKKQQIKNQLSDVEYQFGNWCEIEEK